MDPTSPNPAPGPQHGTPHTYGHQSGPVPPGVPGGWPSAVGTPMPPAPSKKGLGGLAVSLIAVGALAVGCIGGVGIGSAGGSSATGTTAASGTPVDAAAPVDVTSATPTVDPTLTETPTPAVDTKYVPKPSDFSIKIKTITKQCFGSAGCNVTYRIDPTYTGQALTEDQSYTVSYRLSGGEDPEVGSFEITYDPTGAKMSYSAEDLISTPRSSSVLKANVTQVL